MALVQTWLSVLTLHELELGTLLVERRDPAQGAILRAWLDTRVLLWPVGAKDGQHPHCDGWATFVAVQGDLTADEEFAGRRRGERAILLGAPSTFIPEQDVSHHIHNVGSDVGVTIHVFGI